MNVPDGSFRGHGGAGGSGRQAGKIMGSATGAPPTCGTAPVPGTSPAATSTSGTPGSAVAAKDPRHDDSEESGVGHEEEEEMQQLLVELLSNMRTPRVRVISELFFIFSPSQS